MMWKVYNSIQERKTGMTRYSKDKETKYFAKIPPNKHDEFMRRVINQIAETLIANLAT